MNVPLLRVLLVGCLCIAGGCGDTYHIDVSDTGDGSSDVVPAGQTRLRFVVDEGVALPAADGTATVYHELLGTPTLVTVPMRGRVAEVTLPFEAGYRDFNLCTVRCADRTTGEWVADRGPTGLRLRATVTVQVGGAVTPVDRSSLVDNRLMGANIRHRF